MSALQTIALGVAGVFGIRAPYEGPHYEVIEALPDGIEIRRYAPAVVAQTGMNGETERERSGRAFERLFRYISGRNEGGLNLDMTVPVERRGNGDRIAMTVPVETTGESAHGMMRFFLPSTYTLETAPRPRDPAVEISVTPERLLAVMRYTGWASERSQRERMGQLVRTLAATPYRIEGSPFSLFYDPPFTLPFLRRNEAAVEVAREAATNGSAG